MFRQKIDFEADVWNLYIDGKLCDYCDNKFNCKAKTCECLQTCEDVSTGAYDDD